MAGGSKVEVKGIVGLQKKFKSIPQNLVTEFDMVLAKGASDFIDKAIEDAPRDQGVLISQLSSKRNGDMDYEAVSGAEWSAAIEWGTRMRVQIPPDLTTYASQFKGKPTGGDYYDFLNAILDWVKRKGIVSRYSVKTQKEITKYSKDDNERLLDTAQAIANSIIRHGIHPHPFFFIQREPIYKQIIKGASPALQKALK
jgi:hypothetical protein